MSLFERSVDKTFEKTLSYRFRDSSLLRAALTHKSFANESKHSLPNNEKLEFLGDAVLDLVLGHLLMELFPQDQEGSLSKKRASLVNEENLARLAVSLDIPKYLLLGKGELQQGGSLKPRLLASSFEAIVGAIFCDSNYDTTREVVRHLFEQMVGELHTQEDFELDYKTRLQELVQGQFRMTPKYSLVEEIGPPHDRVFRVQLNIHEGLVFHGEGKTKKSSEQNAAQTALKHLTAKPLNEAKDK